MLRGLSKGFGLLRHGVAVGWKTVSLGHKVHEPDSNLHSGQSASVDHQVKERKDAMQCSASARSKSARDRADVAQEKHKPADVGTCECLLSENAELQDNADRDPSRPPRDTSTAIQPATKDDVVACSPSSNECPGDVDLTPPKAVVCSTHTHEQA